MLSGDLITLCSRPIDGPAIPIQSSLYESSMSISCSGQKFSRTNMDKPPQERQHLDTNLNESIDYPINIYDEHTKNDLSSSGSSFTRLVIPSSSSRSFVFSNNDSKPGSFQTINGEMDYKVRTSGKILKEDAEDEDDASMCFGQNQRTGEIGEFPANLVYVIPSLERPTTNLLKLFKSRNLSTLPAGFRIPPILQGVLIQGCGLIGNPLPSGHIRVPSCSE
ncbi:unnamed protein product [Protopolystoma xenopodis]|uniref:Uncharacterized protein n=1 Tax=Protopolystoma xenopodis TaxID=117903 RepID=A0A448WBM4_9PLAT|nr:unnamed protein product [Protopolystoma xenopodis]